MLSRFAREKHSSLLRKSVNCGCNKFYDTGPTSLFNIYFMAMVSSQTCLFVGAGNLPILLAKMGGLLMLPVFIEDALP